MIAEIRRPTYSGAGSGIFQSIDALLVVYSANAAFKKHTASPTTTFVTSGPTAATTPTPSAPSAKSARSRLPAY